MCVEFDYSKLQGKIIEKCGTRMAFANKVGISTVALTQKLKGRVAFKNDEIIHMARILDIPTSDLPLYFFCHSG